MLKRVFFLLTVTLLFANCWGTENESEAQGQSYGTLTLDGKTEKLNHVHARRINRDLHEALVFFLTNKPLPVKELDKRLDMFDSGTEEHDFLNDGATTGLLFVVEKDEPFKKTNVSFDQFIIRSGRLYKSTGMQNGFFEDFSLKQGVARVSISNEFDPALGSTDEEKKGFKYSYRANFETRVEGSSVVKPFDGMPPADAPVKLSGQGTARGSFTVNGKKIDTKYAYALRKRLFFDEPDEEIHVLITERAYSEQELMEIFNKNSVSKDLNGMSLWFVNNPTRSSSVWIHREGLKPFGNINTTEPVEKFSISKEKIAATGGGKGESIPDRAKWIYSVSIDVPFTIGG